MNIVWSKLIQGAKTLYYSRKLRFDDKFATQYKNIFALDETQNMKILEVGCGAGALAGALSRWYPNAEVIAVDRDSEFIRFAKEHEAGVSFSEGDATALAFADNSFDVVISNTVCEHIEPSKFYGEQFRVLKPNGACLVLSSRKGITVAPACYATSEYEKMFWQKVDGRDDTIQKYEVGKYFMNEAELPRAMEKYGFGDVRTDYVHVDLTPDNPNVTPEFAHAVINSDRYSELDAVQAAVCSAPGRFSERETEEMMRIVNQKYDTRIREYDEKKRQWDTAVSLIMIVRGVKK